MGNFIKKMLILLSAAVSQKLKMHLWLSEEYVAPCRLMALCFIGKNPKKQMNDATDN